MAWRVPDTAAENGYGSTDSISGSSLLPHFLSEAFLFPSRDRLQCLGLSLGKVRSQVGGDGELDCFRRRLRLTSSCLVQTSHKRGAGFLWRGAEIHFSIW